MSDNQHSMRSETRHKVYSLNATAKLARVSVEFIQECEREDLIEVTAVGGSEGYDYNTVRRLIRIRHLHRDLGFDLTAIDYLLRMRRQIGTLHNQMHTMEQRMLEREKELMDEIQRLRTQMAQDCNWKTM
jgi:DNA-binding transcriptional MerR regulator